ncbi:4-hydroxythreonine-4-phosphate dehydrogenase PdxA [bacterium CG2_30_54_10]|nr:MAG: 4-hydroxythreonine-4-phosphate dehydrogenase PdxA [bacterium CG2_30_54_10]
MKKKSIPRLAVTLGDPCGIGPEIAARVILESDPALLDRLFFIGPESALESAFSIVGKGKRISKVPAGLKWQKINVEGPFPPGAVCKTGGRAAIQAIEVAHALCMGGACAGMVTCPIGKEAIRLAGSPYAGHTDMLCALARVKSTFMAMVFGRFRVVMTTLHVPLREVPALLTSESVFDAILSAHMAFRTVRKPFPAIAVAGLNPHAGEHGLFGDEEERAIIPAVARAFGINPNISGPYPADSLFKTEMRRKIDAFVAQTHDQGLIAIKAFGGIRCVNVTLGLPYVRTSVGHGTAYDIAGTGQADHRGLQAAIRLAEQLVVSAQ